MWRLITLSNWYKCKVKVGHTNGGKTKFAEVYVKGHNITQVQDKLQNIPAVGGNKKAKEIVKMDNEPPSNQITNPWYGYSKEFKDILNSPNF